MSATFVATLRTRPEGVETPASRAGGATLTLRAQLADAWDAVRVVAAPTDTVAEIKARVLVALDPSADAPSEYLVKVRGFEVLHEAGTLADNEIGNGATLLIAHRRRRPVR